MCVYVNFFCINIFMYLTVDGHLGGFQFGAVLNNAAMNILLVFFGGYMSLVLLDIYLELVLLGHKIHMC